MPDTKYTVTGMSCAACVSRVEKAVLALAGVDECAVNLLTSSMTVGGDAKSETVIAAVMGAGYGASLQGEQAQSAPSEDALADKETPALLRRLVSSLVFLLLLMYLSMGHMLSLPLPGVLQDNLAMQGLTQMLLTLIVLIINRKFFVSGTKALLHRSPNMDTLVALGSAAAFGYSVGLLYVILDAMQKGGDLSPYHHGFYFESAAMIVTLITVGKLLEARSKGKTTNALKSLLSLAPKTATLVKDGVETTISAADLVVGDLFALRPGQAVPTDGEVIEGESAIDESALTGESIPVDKAPGNAVSAGTINRSGFLLCRATKVGGDTALAQIIELVKDASSTKAPIAKMADKVAGVFVPAVMAIALVTFIVWLLLGRSLGYALARGIAVLVISCPCALGLATPVAIMVGSGVGAKAGILFKTASTLETAGRVKVVALDKTGTITRGAPILTDLHPLGVSETELLTLAYSLEAKSEHPLARAVCDAAMQREIAPLPLSSFRILPGSGLEGVTEDGKKLVMGNAELIASRVALAPESLSRAETLSKEGKTPLFLAENGELVGILALADTVKEDSAQAIAMLKKMGIHTVMLTGDNARTAAAIAAKVGVDEVISDVKPDGKEAVIRKLAEKGICAMVGDGINDAPALTAAHLGIAIGTGTDVAIDAADAVLMRADLSGVPSALKLGRAVLKNIRENLFWAFFYNCIGIPLAAGCFIALLGWELEPMFGAAAMSLSSFCVVTNALRLNFLRFPGEKREKQAKSADSADQITLKVKGMMCEHCEKRVADALLALDGITFAHADHKSGKVTLLGSADMDSIKKAIEAAGYRVRITPGGDAGGFL